MGVMTICMLGVCFLWFGCFLYFTIQDLRHEEKKTAILASGEPLDPFLFTGEKARAEAREQYLKDPVAREYLDEIGVTPFLHLEAEKTAE